MVTNQSFLNLSTWFDNAAGGRAVVRANLRGEPRRGSAWPCPAGRKEGQARSRRLASMAFPFWSSTPTPRSARPDDNRAEANEIHCLFCWDVLASHFWKSPPPPVPFATDVQCPLFVTWNKRSSRSVHLQLRGCIGCLKPLPLSSLQDYALTSALHDRRFPPIEEAEMTRLQCTVQLLSPFEPCGLYEWYIGTHGLTINFIDHACGGLARSAVYLPDVIPEQGWTQTEAIDSLIRKSGCEQPITEDLRASLEVSRFTSTRFSVPYERWAALREPPSMATHLSPSLVPPEMPSNRPPTGEETWRSRDEPGAPPSW